MTPQEHLDELLHLTACACGPEWTDRGRHAPTCSSDWRTDVEALGRALGLSVDVAP